MTSQGERLRALARHGLVFVSTAVLGRAAGLLSVVVLTRLMAPADYGVYQLALTWAQLGATVLTLNLYGAISRYAFDQADDFNDFLSGSLAATAGLLTVSSLLLLIFIERVSYLTGLAPRVLYATIIGVWVVVAFNVFRHIVIAKQLSGLMFRIEVTRDYLTLPCIAAAVHYSTGAPATIATWTRFLIWGVFATLALRTLPRLKRPRWNPAHWRYIAGYALPLVPYVIGTFALGQIDRVLLFRLRGAEDAGLYSVIYNLAMMLPLIAASLQRTLLPDWFALRNTDETTKADLLALAAFLIVAGLGSMLLLFADEVVQILADARYHAAGGLMWIIVLGYVFDDLARIHTRIIGYTRRMIYVSIIGLLGAGLNVGLNLLWIPDHGIAGAAWATFASFAATAMLYRWCARYVLHQAVPPLRSFVLPLGLVAATALVRDTLTGGFPLLVTVSLKAAIAILVAWVSIRRISALTRQAVAL